MQKPNFRVLSDFRKEHREYFKECFKQSVLLSMTAGLVSLGHLSLNGWKFKANTSKHKAMSYGRLKAKETEKNFLQQLEHSPKIRKFSLRVVEKVAGEFSLVCAVHNIKKIIRAIKDELVSVIEGKMLPQAA